MTLRSSSHLTHGVAVMYLGKIVDLADRATLFSAPAAPLHAGAAARSAGDGPRGQAVPHHPDRRRPNPDHPTERPPVLYPLSRRIRPLPDGGAEAPERRNGPCIRV